MPFAAVAVVLALMAFAASPAAAKPKVDCGAVQSTSWTFVQPEGSSKKDVTSTQWQASANKAFKGDKKKTCAFIAKSASSLTSKTTGKPRTISGPKGWVCRSTGSSVLRNGFGFDHGDASCAAVSGGRATGPAFAIVTDRAVALAPQTGRAAKKKKVACSTAGTTLVASSQSRVYSLAKNSDDPVYACYAKAGKKILLATFRNCSDSSSFAGAVLAGPYIAYVTGSCDLVDERETLRVLDLRTGKVLKTTDATSDVGAPNTRFRGMVVTAKGSVAWIGFVDGDTTKLTEVYKWDSGGKVKLDAGDDVAQDSLALGGTTLYWLKGATAKSASLS
jgi:hypothetical protein